MERILFSGKLENGVAAEVVEAKGYSGKTELVVKIGKELASVSLISILRSGDVQIATTSNRIRIKASDNPISDDAKKPPTLKDVASS